jgi:glycosyltransferase involved in cell wall biosynthesis
MAFMRRLLIVTNRFHPQLGGAELNIYYQARELAKHFEVDVVTPLRDNDPKREEIDGFRVFRQYNLYNPLNRMPYKGHRALCPALPTRILSGGYDLIHCFPAPNPNNNTVDTFYQSSAMINLVT